MPLLVAEAHGSNNKAGNIMFGKYLRKAIKLKCSSLEPGIRMLHYRMVRDRLIPIFFPLMKLLAEILVCWV